MVLKGAKQCINGAKARFKEIIEDLVRSPGKIDIYIIDQRDKCLVLKFKGKGAHGQPNIVDRKSQLQSRVGAKHSLQLALPI